MKDSVCVDFDGVIAQENGWQGVDFLGDPIPGAKEFLENLSKDFEIIIFTCRCTEGINGVEKGVLLANRVRAYMQKHELPFDQIYYGQGKPIAKAYIDDRGICCRPQEDSMAYAKALLMLSNVNQEEK